MALTTSQSFTIKVINQNGILTPTQSNVPSISGTGVLNYAAANAAYTNAVSYVTAQSYANTFQVTSNSATAYSNAVSYVATNYPNNTQLSSNLANYQTSAGLSANVATLTSNNSIYHNGVTLATINTAITSNATTAYTNAVSYVTAQSYANTLQVTSNAATAYSNAIAYSGNAALAYSNAIAYSGNAALAYSNAVTYVAANYPNNTQLTSNLSNYALLSGGLFTGSVNATSFSVGTAFTANATLANTPAINVVGQTNTATLYVTTSANVGTAFVANSLGVYTTGTINAASFSVGTAFTTNSTVLYVSGKAGIGSPTSSEATLHIGGNYNAATFDNSGMLFRDTSFSGDNRRMVIGPIGASDSMIRYMQSGSLVFLASAGTEVARITSSGYVGIGTSSPAVQLDVVGQIRATDGAVDLRMLPLNASSAATIGTFSASDLVFVTGAGGTGRMRVLASNGNVGIGTSSPGYLLDVNGTSNFSGVLNVGSNIIPTTDNSSNLGSLTNRWANIYTGDLVLSNEGSEGNIVDKTTGNWTIQEGDENLYIINNKSGKKYKFSLTEV